MSSGPVALKFTLVKCNNSSAYGVNLLILQLQVSSGTDFYPELLELALYKTLIRPIVTYGAETWTMMKKGEQALLIFERKIFRRIYGPKYEDGEWKIRTNRELEVLNKGENIVKWIKGQRISWLGHLEKMEEDRMPKKIFTQELERTRRRGRHRKGWREEIEKDLRVLVVRRWRELVIDREKWKGIVRQAKAHSGL